MGAEVRVELTYTGLWAQCATVARLRGGTSFNKLFKPLLIKDR